MSQPGDVAEPVHIAGHVPGRCVVAVHRNIAIMHWMSAGRPEGVQLLNQTCEKYLSPKYKHGFSAVHMVRENAGLPDTETRKELGACMTRWAPHMGCVAVVLMGAGFWVSAIQSVITGIRMISPMGSVEMRFVRDLPALTPWFLAEHGLRTAEQISSDELQKVLTQVLRVER